jgi:hypothetical protein
MSLTKFISPLIASQFPSFYQEEGPNFIKFVEAYYEWMEQPAGVIKMSRSIPELTDIDETLVDFIKYFKQTFILSLPESIIADKRLLVKHILDLYRSKGTKKAYSLLFRMLFNEDIELYIPGDHLFKPSAAKWNVPKYIEVSDFKYMYYLIGKQIYSASGFGVVENYFTKMVNNKLINVLLISNLEGNFKFGEQIYSGDLYINSAENIIDYKTYTDLFNLNLAGDYSPLLTPDNAPKIFGSLSSVSILNGGINFNLGDLLTVSGSGQGAIAKVVSTAEQNGKVTFRLVDGGYGFTRNPSITVTGGYGSGATFKVGDISNISIYRINQDQISDYFNGELDIDGSGFNINITGATGSFTVGETITSTANVITFDVNQIQGFVANGDVLSNSSLGISNLQVYRSDGSYLGVTGPDGNETPILNANLVAGAILVNGTNTASPTYGSVQINTRFPKQVITSNAVVVTANSSVLYVDNIVSSVNGSNTSYVFPYVLDKIVAGKRVGGLTSGKYANVVSVERLTNWGFPHAVDISNLDVPNIESILNTIDLEVGSITYLSQINPGVGYSAAPTVEIVEPLIYDLKIPNGKGGFYGYDAIVTTKAGIANGVVTGIEIVDSGYGYNPDEKVTLSNANNVTSSVTGATIVDLTGVGSGYWTDNNGFSSDESFIQDSYYYQQFSYEIVAKRMINTYEKYVKDLIHPSGVAMFGKFINKNEMLSDSSQIVYNTMVQE